MQTTIPPFAKTTFGGISTITGKEGFGGLYKGLYPLWGRQIPYTMMKFASFETIVEAIYHYLPGSKPDYSKSAQIGVSFTGGYLAGILCAIVSHPADVMVSKLNATRQPGEVFGAAMGRIYKDIGFGGLWNGLPVRIVMIGTLTGLQWMIYDYFKVFLGLPSTVSFFSFVGLGGEEFGNANVNRVDRHRRRRRSRPELIYENAEFDARLTSSCEQRDAMVFRWNEYYTSFVFLHFSCVPFGLSFLRVPISTSLSWYRMYTQYTNSSPHQAPLCLFNLNLVNSWCLPIILGYNNVDH
jgi:hypothetical protein